MPARHYVFETYKSQALPRDYDGGINELVAESLAEDFLEWDDNATNVRHRVLMSRDTRRNLNRGIGRSLAGGQHYARQQTILAFTSKGSLVGYATVADNASSRRPGIAGPIEVAAKLYTPPAVGEKLPMQNPVLSRHRAFGLVAIAASEREVLAEAPITQSTFVTTMVALGLSGALQEQPVSAYPWEEERAWKDNLRVAGLRPDGLAQPDHLFGETYPAAQLERWTAPTMAGSMATLAALEDSEAWFERIGLTVDDWK